MLFVEFDGIHQEFVVYQRQIVSGAGTARAETLGEEEHVSYCFLGPTDKANSAESVCKYSAPVNVVATATTGIVTGHQSTLG